MRKYLMLRHAPGRARTCNPMIRSHILYPINLRAAYKRGQITYLRMAMSIKRVVSTGKEFFRRSRAQLSRNSVDLSLLIPSCSWLGRSFPEERAGYST
jgi:hypothetical protein